MHACNEINYPIAVLKLQREALVDNYKQQLNATRKYMYDVDEKLREIIMELKVELCKCNSERSILDNAVQLLQSIILYQASVFRNRKIQHMVNSVEIYLF